MGLDSLEGFEGLVGLEGLEGLVGLEELPKHSYTSVNPAPGLTFPNPP